MNSILRTTTITTTIIGVNVEVKLTIQDNYAVSFDFTLHGSPYTFVITKWSGHNFAKLSTLFFSASERDTYQFGRLDNMDTTQKLNLIEQGVKDILTCIDKIGCHYQHSILDYAVWYCDNHHEIDSYEKYITRVTCSAITQVLFIIPNINWDVINFII